MLEKFRLDPPFSTPQMRYVRKILPLVCLIAVFLFSPSGYAIGVEETPLAVDSQRLTVASFNVHNLDPQVEDITKVRDRSPRNVDDDLGKGQFTALGKQIVTQLKNPDIIALQEVQDNDGAELSAVVDATRTAQTLIDAIRTAKGPRYLYRDISPQKDSDGGQEGGNIRVGYLFNPERVKLRKLERFPDDVAFQRSRKPLIGEFSFNNRPITLINNHFTSQIGGDSVDRQRKQQAALVNRYVSDRLKTNPQAAIIVLGDFNDTPDSPTITTLKGTVLQNLDTQLPKSDRYSILFNKERQLIDQILVSDNLARNAAPQFSALHLNTGRTNAPSDHDPVLARFTLSSR
jgi:predicted extracellular nuclease